MSAYRLLFDDLMERLSWRFPVLVVWTALVGLTEGASIILLLPLLNRLGIVASPSQGFVNSLMERGLGSIGANGTATILAAIIVIATIQTILSVALNWWSVRLARDYESQHQLELFAALMRAKWTFLADRKVGDMTNAIVVECERLGRAFLLSLLLLGSAIVALVYVGLSALVAWQAVLCLVGFALAAALAMTGFYRKSYAVGESMAPLNARLQSMLVEQFTGAKFIKASVGADRAFAQLAPLVHQRNNAYAVASVMPGTVRGLLEYVALIGLAGTLVAASMGMGVAPANVVIVLALFGRLFPRLTTVQAQLYSLNANVHAIETVDTLQAAAEAETERLGGPGNPLNVTQPSALIVRNLRAQFGERIVLDQINLRLPIPGLLAVVGRSGAGKSTLVHTLLGLIEPSRGSIELGGYDFAATPLAFWRRAIGYVPQETILFHASIRDNLRLINSNASESELEVAIRRANAFEFIRSLPQGLDTVIGDQGVKLSGGQRQRLGIARALLMNPAILVLDEAMSALDAHSEAEVLRTLEELRKQMGVLLVAHRLAAARAADIVCVLEAGRVVEAGPWNELIARKARLFALAEAQSVAGDRSSAAL